jgi:type IV pilus assembly protein PilQ
MTVFTRATVKASLVLLLSTVALGESSQSPVTVETLEMNPTPKGVEFTVRSTGKVRYSYFKLEGPRLVVDFHKASNGLGILRKKVGQAGVAQVRTSSFTDPDRDVTRVVFDLEHEVPFEIVDHGSGEVLVRFASEAAASFELPAVPREAPEVGVTLPTLSPNVDASDAKRVAAVDVATAGTEKSLERSAPSPEFVAQVAPESLTAAGGAAQGEILLASLQSGVESGALTQDEPVGLTDAAEIEPGGVSEPQIVAAPPAAIMSQAVEPQESFQYTGELVSFDFRELPLQDFFRLIGDISGLNVILDPAVGGTVTLLLRDVPWDQALDVVLRNNNLGYELEGNVLRVATRATLQAEEDAARVLREAQELNAPLETRTFILSYTQADTVSATIQELLSPRGTIITDTRRNALIVNDIPNRFGRIDPLITFLDTPAQQVEIEARLLSATKSFSRDLGSQIGLLVGNNSQNALTGIPNSLSPFDRIPDTAVGANLPLIADFPSAGATSGLSYLLGAGGDVLLDAIITAAEARGTAKLLSRPRVTTQNNQPATVSQGTQIPVQTNVNNTITVTFVDFSLNLTVTPQITEEGTILLTAAIENSSPDFGRTVGTSQIPSVSTQQAQTQVLIPDGGTAVVGGILLDTDSVNVSQVPGLGNIPVLGNLFKSTQVVRSTSELLFFITARIKPTNPLEFLSDSGSASSEGISQ